MDCAADALFSFDKRLAAAHRRRKSHPFVLVGIDEAGRGPLAGPVVASAVILPSDFYHPDLNDSKQVSPASRVRVFG